MKGATARKLSAIWQSSGDALLLADAETRRLLDANPQAEALFGRTAEEIRSLGIEDIHPPDRLAEVLTIFSRGAAVPDKFTDQEILRSDGVRIPVEISAGSFTDDDGRLVAIGSFRDISERVLAEGGTRRLNWALTAVNRAALAIATAETEADMMRLLCEGLTGDMFTISWIGVPDDTLEDSVAIAAAAGAAFGYLDGIRLSRGDNPYGRGPLGRAFREGKTQVNNHPPSNPGFAPWSKRAEEHEIRSSIACPMVRNGTVFGVLTIYSNQPNAFVPEIVRLVEDLTRELVVGLDARRHRDAYEAEVKSNLAHTMRYRAALEQTVAALASTIEKRDPYTAGHQRRVCDLAMDVALKLGWDSERCQSVYLAGLVHDIGKINVPSEILNKPGKLLAIEFELVKLHPMTGYEILNGIDFPWKLAEITRQHHERLDGSGYPDGLTGDEILPEAQVIAVADVFEAMSSHRPYRPALGRDAGIAELRRLRGDLLDADIVDAAIAVFLREKAPAPHDDLASP
ncbi:MAG: HD domain-containing phosphohydrolase [Rhodospirillaceae bacterium]